MSAVKTAFLLRRTVHNPALGVPRKVPRRSPALEAARLLVCQPCRFYVQRDGQHRCTHVDRKCELLNLARFGETCPIGAWKEAPRG